MLLKYFYDTALAHASYMVGCQRSGTAVIVDPGRDIAQYLEAAAREGMKITGVAETHIHADYVSGARELAEKTGGTLYVSDTGPAEWKYQYASRYSHRLLKDGDTFSVGKVEFKTLATPGHTPESISFVLTDRGGGADRPMGIFTGDFVFVGSIGRPDLLEEAAGLKGTSEPGARELFRSIRKFRELPDYLQVWPAHGAGSACGKGLGAIPSSTVGYEKLFNPALQFANEQEFVDYILAEQPEPPKYFALMKRVNKEGPAVPGFTGLPEKQAAAEIVRLAVSGQVVDVRPGKKFVEAHVPGSLSIETKYLAMWAGSLLDYSVPVYLIGSETEVREAVRILAKIGVEKFGGFFEVTEVQAAGWFTESFRQQDVATIAKRVAVGEIELVDIRGATERKESRVAGSGAFFLGAMTTQPFDFEEGKNYAFICRSGGRSVIAASVAKKLGAGNVINVQGGILAWEEQGLPLVRGESTAESACVVSRTCN
jgi:hydroxyacylglutathione hydrolase